VITDPIDDLAGAIGIINDTADRLPDLSEAQRLLV